MNVLYIGKGDILADSVLQRLIKDGHKVFCITDRRQHIQNKSLEIYEYSMNELDSQIDKIMSFVRPDTIIYAGNTAENALTLDTGKGLSQFQHILIQGVQNKVSHILLFSSLDVYGAKNAQTKKILEENALHPVNLSGIYYAQLENMLQLFQEYQNNTATILRLGPVFYGKQEMKIQGNIFEGGKSVQPVHANDIAAAIGRLLDSNDEKRIFNVCGSTAFQRLENGHIEKTDIVFSNDKLKKAIEWTDCNDFNNCQFGVEAEAEDDGKKSKGVRAILGKVLGNLILFVIFLIPQLLFEDCSLLQNVDWMLLYVAISALSFGLLQGSTAVALASITCLFVENIKLFQVGNIYSYLYLLIRLAEYIFFGLAIGYFRDMLKNKYQDMQTDYQLLNEKYQELKYVHMQNSQIMEEYESRMLNASESLPKLQAIVARLNVLQPDKIFMEINFVVAELLSTNTVAVYRRDENSNYLRLTASLNEQSTYGGKTWNLDEYPESKKGIERLEVVGGDAWKEEPAMVIPVVSKKHCIAVIMIKELSMEKRTLYYLNLMRTISKLISQYVSTAVEYERLTEEQRYVEGTTVLSVKEFQNQIALAEEMKQNHIADYTVLKIEAEDWREIYLEVDCQLRSVDYLGLNEMGTMSVILSNTGKADCGRVIERFHKKGINAVICE